MLFLGHHGTHPNYTPQPWNLQPFSIYESLHVFRVDNYDRETVTWPVGHQLVSLSQESTFASKTSVPLPPEHLHKASLLDWRAGQVGVFSLSLFESTRHGSAQEQDLVCFVFQK